MPQYTGNIPVIAGNSLTVCSFVTLNDGSTTPAPNSVFLQITNTANTFGITGEAASAAPTPSNNATLAASAGDPVLVFGPGQECYLIAGSGGFTAGDLLASDSSGHGITNTTNNTAYGAVALETVSATQKGKVRVQAGWLSNA